AECHASRAKSFAAHIVLGFNRILIWPVMAKCQVLIAKCCLRSLRRLLMLLLRSLLGSQDRVQRVAFLAWPELDNALFADVFNQAFQDLASQVGARHLTTAEENGGLNFVSFVEKTQHMVLFSFVIVVVHIDAEL